jgi:hypothetical protein
MTQPTDRPTPRREFIGQLATSAALLAGTACAAPLAATATGGAAPAPTPAQAQPETAGRTQWDDSWFTRLTAKHKAAFDSAQVEEGAVLGHAQRYVTGMRDALNVGDSDVQAVLIIRHAAIPMAFNDAMWAKYEIGKGRSIKDGNDWATRNPYLNSRRPTTGDRPSATLSWFASHGHILLGCGVAAQGLASQIASERKLDSKVVFEEMKANLVPGMILQPNGVYATIRAQEAGCVFFKSS